MIEMNVSQAIPKPIVKEQPAKEYDRTDSFADKLEGAIAKKEEAELIPMEEQPKEKEPVIKEDAFSEQVLYALQGLNPLANVPTDEVLLTGQAAETEVLPILSGVTAATNMGQGAQGVTQIADQTVASSETQVQGMPIVTDEMLQQQTTALNNAQQANNGFSQIETAGQVDVPEEMIAAASPKQQEFSQPLQSAKQEETAQVMANPSEIPQATEADNIIPVTPKTTQEGELQADDFGRNSESLKSTNEGVHAVDAQAEPIVLNRDTAFVKISDASSQLKTASAEQQVIEVIKQYVGQEKSEFSVQLFPEHLGKVDVKMVMQNGILTVEIAAENPKTQSLLLSNASEIKELVQAATATTAQIVQPNQSEQAQQHYTQQESAKEQQGQSQEEPKQHQQQQENEMDFFSMLEQMRLENRIQRVSL